MEIADPRAVPVSAAGPKALVHRLVDQGINGGDLAVLDRLLAPGSAPPSFASAGPGGVKALLARYRQAVPDARWTITEQIAEGETVVTVFVATGTQRGPLFGPPATGRAMAVSGILVSRCRGGRIVAQRLQLDLLGLLMQLRVMPELTVAEEETVARLLQESRAWTGEAWMSAPSGRGQWRGASPCPAWEWVPARPDQPWRSVWELYGSCRWSVAAPGSRLDARRSQPAPKGDTPWSATPIPRRPQEQTS